MEISSITTSRELSLYDHWVKAHPEGSLWQSLEWKQYQEALGREVVIYITHEQDTIVASALVVIDRTAFDLASWDIPRGPLGTEGPETGTSQSILQKLLWKIISDAQSARCFSLYLSPPIPFPTQVSRSGPEAPLFEPEPQSRRQGRMACLKSQVSKRHEQPEATRIIDLSRTEEEILAQMKPKGRYNIAVAKRHGISTERSQDIETFHALLQKTAGRHGFQKGASDHYTSFLRVLPGSFLLLAFTPQKNPIAGLLGVLWPPQHPQKGIFYYGASSHAERALMAPSLLQWEAMQFCQEHGCQEYDLLGIAPLHSPLDHPWKGISDFKEKFGGRVTEYPPESQITLKPLSSTLLNLKRRVFG